MSKTTLINGIIDLVFFIALIALFVFYYEGYKNQEEHLTKGMIVVNFWPPSSSIPFDSTYGDYKRITLTGEKQNDSTKMAEIQNHLKVFKAKIDEVSGVHIVFTGNSKYGDFIEVLEYCLQEGISQYIPYRNNLWIPSGENFIK